MLDLPSGVPPPCAYTSQAAYLLRVHSVPKQFTMGMLVVTIVGYYTNHET